MDEYDKLMEKISPGSKQDKDVIFHKKAIGLLIYNFFIWFIPGIVVLAVSLVILIILVGAAATGIEIDIYKRLPKGLVSFLGIGFGLLGITLLVFTIFYSAMDYEGIIICIAVAIVYFILSYDGITKELKRLSKVILESENKLRLKKKGNRSAFTSYHIW
ncbi:MAG: hypothetical protein IEMM0008_1165 [bacterium]|nr:MAG: hypothetical protein IEMM0008_1165 [bacterium]